MCLVPHLTRLGDGRDNQGVENRNSQYALNFTFFFQVNDVDFLAGLCSEVNTTMKELTLIDLRVVTQVSIVELARTHPALVHLTLSGCKGLTDWSVQAIFKYMVSNLFVLSLHENLCILHLTLFTVTPFFDKLQSR